MNNIRRQELRRIAATMKSLSADLAAVQSAADMLKAIVAAASF